MGYDRYGQWVSDNSDIPTSPDGIDEQTDASSLMPDDTGPLDGGPASVSDFEADSGIGTIPSQ